MTNKLNFISIYHFKKKMSGWYINNVMSIILQDMVKIAILEDRMKFNEYECFSCLPEEIKKKLILLKRKELYSKEYEENKKYWDTVYVPTTELEKFIDNSDSNKTNKCLESPRSIDKLKAVLYIIATKHYGYDVNLRNSAVSKIVDTCQLKGFKIASNTISEYLKDGHDIVCK